MNNHRTILIDELLGRMVHDRAGRRVGRIEEFIARRRDGTYVIEEIHLGPAALLQRLAMGSFLAGFIGALGAIGDPTSHSARWEQIDLTYPRHPTLNCAVSDLKEIT